jgi:hypothetical protein
MNNYPCSCEQAWKTKCGDCGVVIPAWTKFIIVGLTNDKPDSMEYRRCVACHQSAQQGNTADATIQVLSEVDLFTFKE